MFASSLMSPALFHFQNAFVIFVQALLFCQIVHFHDSPRAIPISFPPYNLPIGRNSEGR